MKTIKNNIPLCRILCTFLLTATFLLAHGQTGSAAEFELIFSNDIRGEIEPCG